MLYLLHDFLTDSLPILIVSGCSSAISILLKLSLTTIFVQRLKRIDSILCTVRGTMRCLELLSIVLACSITTSAANVPAPFPSPGELATFATSAPNVTPGPPVTATSEVLEPLIVAAQQTPCPGPPQVLQREAASSSYQHTLFCLSWEALSSGELATGSGEVSPPVFPQANGKGEMIVVADRDDVQATTPSEGSPSAVPTPSSSSSSVPAAEPLTPSPNIPTSIPPAPTINPSALEQCFHPPPQPSSPSASPNCEPFLTHLSTCHDRLSPWTDPYDSAQSAAFQTCLCQTSATMPFGPEAEVWRDFSRCAECLTAREGEGEGAVGVGFGKLTEELER